jgi:hypothetical protein
LLLLLLLKATIILVLYGDVHFLTEEEEEEEEEEEAKHVFFPLVCGYSRIKSIGYEAVHGANGYNKSMRGKKRIPDFLEPCSRHFFLFF